MYCFARFINNTSSSVISISVDDSRIFSDVLNGCATPYASLSIGTREITVLQNNDRQYINANISLPPYNRCTILLEDTSISIVPD